MLIYVASPYSHPNPKVRDYREFVARRYVTKKLFEEPKIIRISPIVYWHSAAKLFRLESDAAYYWEYNMELLKHCDSVEVLCMENWGNSVGVAELEIPAAMKMGKGIKYIDQAFI